MTLHLTLRRPVPVPSTQLRIVWQGVRIGDATTASWTDESGRLQVWRADANLAWLQRDYYVPGEEWKINLAGIPAGVDAMTFRLTSSTPRSVAMAILPLAGDPDEGMVHPGTELVADRACELLQLRSAGGEWTVIATNTVGPDSDSPVGAVKAPSASGAPYESDAFLGGARDPSPFAAARQLPIPQHLQPAVDKIRAAGGAVRRAHVDAVVDISASMRPWLVSGLVADTLSAVLAVTGASSRPSLSLRFSPGTGPIDLPLDADPGEVLRQEIGRYGLRTGNHLQLRSVIDEAAARGGVVFVISDDAAGTPPGSPSSTLAVVLGDPPPAAAGNGRTVISVGPGAVDVEGLARELALALPGVQH